MRHMLILLLCSSTAPVGAQGLQPLLDTFRVVQDSVQGDVVAAEPAVINKAILGPTNELLPPALATKQLRGNDYFEWCLRWNKLQYSLASQRAVAPRTIFGTESKSSYYRQGVPQRSFWGRSRNVASNTHGSTTSERRQRVWQVGGYGGGPVWIYNPLVAKP